MKQYEPRHASMSPDDRWRVAHMIEAAEQALAFLNRRSRGDLDTDAMLRLALTPMGANADHTPTTIVARLRAQTIRFRAV